MQKNQGWMGWILAFSLGALMACTPKSQNAAAPAAGASSAGKKTLNLAIWSNYITPEQLKAFEDKTGIHVEVSNYSSNEELLAKLQAGASGYDVVVPSDYMVFAMSKLGLIRELDYKQIPNAQQLDPTYLKKAYDPENKFSVPYDWGTTGIAVNRSLYKGPIKGWKDVFGNAALKGKYTLLDDSREVIAATLKSLGFSLNTTDAGQLAKAKAALLKARPDVKAFNSETLQGLVNGEMAVAHAYSSDALQARKQTGGKIEYVIPEEGATLWVDNLVIPASAKNVGEAHAFINFMLDPQTNLSTVSRIFVGPANRGVMALLPKDLQTDGALFPPAGVQAKLEMFKDLGDSLAAWEKIWTEVKVNSGD